jgi:hypothetical protein
LDAVERAKALLRSKGYVVIPEERRVILQARYIIPAFEMEGSKVPNFIGLAFETNIRRITAEIANPTKGLCVHRRRDIEDGITGREVVLETALGVIVQKPEDEV